MVRILKSLDVSLHDAYGACRCQPARTGNVTPSTWSRAQVSPSPDMPSKSIFRQPGTQHFQLVHRSQRDPLINDPDASQHVLKPVVRENARKVILSSK
jgi:Low temperature viability protein